MPGILLVRRGISPLPPLVGQLEYASLWDCQRKGRPAGPPKTVWERHPCEAGRDADSIRRRPKALVYAREGRNPRSADRFAENELCRCSRRWTTRKMVARKAMRRRRMGFLGVTVAAEFGGAASDFFTSGLIAAGGWRAGIRRSRSATWRTRTVRNHIRRATGRRIIRKRYLPKTLRRASAIGALGLTEPGPARRDRRNGDDRAARRRSLCAQWQQAYITNGPSAECCSYAKTTDPRGSKGIRRS